MRYLLLVALFMGCGGEDQPEIYETKCPEVELGEHIGYLSIEGVDGGSFAYWACVGDDCSGEHSKEYGVYTKSMGEDVVRICCGVRGRRVDRVNVVMVRE